MRKLSTLLFFIVLAALLTGCAHLGIEPWQRGDLAKPEMAFDCEPVSFGMDDHIYFSKEAVNGGGDYAGGGCGCN